MAVETPFGQDVVGTTALTVTDWCMAIGLAMVFGTIEGLTKAIRRRDQRTDFRAGLQHRR